VLVRALVRELTTGAGAWDSGLSVPMSVTYAPKLTYKMLSDHAAGTTGADPSRPIGILELYVCTQCGFSEWYCRNPKDIPIGEELGTELIDVGPREPYR